MGCRKWAQCTPQGRVVQTKCAGNNQAVPLPTPSEITTGELARAVTDHHAYCRLKWTDEKYPLSEAHRTTEGHSLQGDLVGPLQLRWIWKRKNVELRAGTQELVSGVEETLRGSVGKLNGNSRKVVPLSRASVQARKFMRVRASMRAREISVGLASETSLVPSSRSSPCLPASDPETSSAQTLTVS